MQVQQIEKFTGQPVSDEQYARMETGDASTAGISRRSAIVHVHADRRARLRRDLLVVFNAILGGTATFKQVLGDRHALAGDQRAGRRARRARQYIKGTMSIDGPVQSGGAGADARGEELRSSQFLAFIEPSSRLGHHRDRDRSRRALPAQERQHRDRACSSSIASSVCSRGVAAFHRAGNLNDSNKKILIGLGRRGRARRDRLRQLRVQAHDRHDGHASRRSRSATSKPSSRRAARSSRSVGQHQRRDDGQGRRT